MKLFAQAHYRQWLMIVLLLASVLSLSRAAEPPPRLKIRESDVYLYAQQDNRSDRLATLQKDEPLTLVAEAVGTQTWYMVRTRHGLIGWVQEGPTLPSAKQRKRFSQKKISPL